MTPKNSKATNKTNTEQKKAIGPDLSIDSDAPALHFPAIIPHAIPPELIAELAERSLLSAENTLLVLVELCDVYRSSHFKPLTFHALILKSDVFREMNYEGALHSLLTLLIDTNILSLHRRSYGFPGYMLTGLGREISEKLFTARKSIASLSL